MLTRIELEMNRLVKIEVVGQIYPFILTNCFRLIWTGKDPNAVNMGLQTLDLDRVLHQRENKGMLIRRPKNEF
jgi:hypothetical protein